MRKSTVAALHLLWASLLSLCLHAQNSVVTGKVTEGANNAPVIGASIIVTGTTVGTTTDNEGKFKISMPAGKNSITISSAGFKSQTVKVSSGQDLSIKMEEDYGKLDEVVITGLASGIKRTNLANSVASVSARDLNGTTVQSTMDGALYGKFTGANISENSGAPGGGISIKLRGITSLVANSQPLYIVDGVYYDNSAIPAGLNAISKAAGQGSVANQDNPSNRIADLDPEDIDRIEILKGASAAAIYGSRAAGGVVLITTKRGKAGKPKIEVGQTTGVQWQLKKLGMRSWDEDKVVAAYGASKLPLYQAAGGKVYDYEDELYGEKGLMSTTRVSISGGGDKTSYFAGYTRKNDDGIVAGTGYKKNSIRLNLDQKLAKFLDLSINSNYVESEANRGYFNNDNTSTTLGVSFVSTPSWVELHPDANGNYPNNPLAPSNFLQTRDLITNKEKINRFLLGGTVTLKLYNDSKNDLRIIGRAGLDYYTLNTIAIFPRELQFEKDGNGTNGASIYGTTITRNSNYNAFILHNYTPSDKLNFKTQIGVTQENVDLDNVLSTATQLIGTQTNLNQAGAIQVQENKVKQIDKGFFGQEEINFNDVLIATIGVRGDKSSRNGDPDKIYYYPKASAALNINQLGFWKWDNVSQFKIRAAYGESGNFAPFGAIYSPLVPAVFNNNTGSLIGLVRGNENLKPERQKELEAGVDLGILKNRLGIEFTYYQKKVEDLLLNVAVPTSSGFSTAWENVAAIKNNGVEIALNALPISGKNWKWNTRVNFWTNKAKVTRLDVPAFNTGAFGATLGTYRIEEGKSPTQLVGIGTADQKPDPSSGLVVFGDAEPDFQMSFQNTITWKRFEFAFLMHWKEGGNNINLTTLLSDIFGTSPDYDKKTLDPAGQKTNGDYRLAALGVTAQPWIENSGYFRVREIGLYYSMPKEWFKSIAAVKVGLSAHNLINFFKYSSYDPEVSNFGIDAISSNVEVTPFPSAKSVHFDVTITF